MHSHRRTQAQRRSETRQAVLDSACRRFGAHGYGATALEDIATDCGLTTRPIYHYFGNKQALFAAVNEAMEVRILEGLGSDGLMGNWLRFLALCEDPHFRQVVLVDSPKVLGRERWRHSPVVQRALAAFQAEAREPGPRGFRRVLLARVLMAAFSEAALTVAEAEDQASARREATELVSRLVAGLGG